VGLIFRRSKFSAALVSFGVALLAMLLATSAVAAPGRTHRLTRQEACPNRVAPPPPVDTSEQPPPGMAPPQALAVPDKPVGGPRMAECSLVQPEGAATPPATISSASWVLADLDSGAVLAARDPHARHRPASLMKTLLAIVVARELKMDTVIVGTQEDANQEGTRVGLGPGGQYTVEQLLFTLMMKSGNDAAHALARQLGGVPEALRKMNAVAAELGALDTRAASPSGLDGPGMSTSAYDIGVLFRVAMKYPKIAEAVGMRQIVFPGYGGRPNFQVNNDNKLLFTYDGFLGGKTGFTDDARHTYLGSAMRDRRRLVVVLLRSESQPVKIADQAAQLLDYGYALVAASAKPVGQLVDRAPGPDDDTGRTLAAPATDSGNTDQSSFGNVGAPLTVLAGALVLLVGLMFWRRRRARPRPFAGVGAAVLEPDAQLDKTQPLPDDYRG
jgi:D-alanyl-D-alanine carboxypeptidase (penicillin-binding protein 5/6)